MDKVLAEMVDSFDGMVRIVPMGDKYQLRVLAPTAHSIPAEFELDFEQIVADELDKPITFPIYTKLVKTEWEGLFKVRDKMPPSQQENFDDLLRQSKERNRKRSTSRNRPKADLAPEESD